MRTYKTTLDGILETSAHNDQKVLERADKFWAELLEVLVSSKENFTLFTSDLSQVRERFNMLVKASCLMGFPT